MDEATLETWRGASAKQRVHLIDNVVAAAPSGFELSRGVSGADLLPMFVHARTATEWIFIPGGSFSMGLSAEEEKAARAIADPPPLNIHEMRPCRVVTVRPFLVMKAPVTWSLVSRVLTVDDMEDRPEFDGPREAQPAYLHRDEIEALARADHFRLPTEEQWEWACRGGTRSLFFFGDTLPEDESLLASFVAPDLRTCKPNPFGLLGLFVGEWCRDHFRPAYDQAPSQNDFCVRGGATVFWPWQGSEWAFCISAMRMPSSDLAGGLCGARLVVDLAE
ncbi:MAG TPA: SUMF1/EgtB/PvdO family nonheme iron enzyme [Polyangiaceae bacterium]